MSALLLLLAAAAHTSIGLQQGLSEGDFGLLWFAVPLVVVTAMAAFAVQVQRRWSSAVALVLTSLALVLAVALVPVYLVGLFHLPQAGFALAVVVRHRRLRSH